ncbi:di-trans,poly-cis-decaprenylcistransferase [Candidatus Pacearchaeota archaeon]|nr:di-trans,poly-cis-decaprenylcistransferase [Candidatus Pacearchaeota archaeon]
MELTHIAIIPDGNRRWAKKNKTSIKIAYNNAIDYKRTKKIIESARKEGAGFFSIWGFSTENWKRSAVEREAIFKTIFKAIESFEAHIEKDKYKFICIGRRDRIPKYLALKIKSLEEKTKEFDRITIILAIDYGGRDEIIRAIKKSKGVEVNEENFRHFLDTKDIPDPDIIIRTGGEKRLSGYMPFQSAYSEIYFINKLFPDFSSKDLKKIIKDFQERKRRFGE